MLVPKLRFKEFTDEWNTTKFSDICTNISYGMNAAAKEFDGLNKYIRITDIDENNNTFTKSNFVSPNGLLEKKYIVRENDILFARTGASTGKPYLYNKHDGLLYFAGFLIRFNVNAEYNAKFIFQQFKTKKYNDWVRLMSMRSGQPGINANEYSQFDTSICSIKEQEKIAKLFTLLDRLIDLQQRKIEALKLYKLYSFNNLLNNTMGEEIYLKEILKKWNKKNNDNKYQYVESVSNKYGFISQNEQFEDRNVASLDKSNYYVIEENVFAYNPSRLNVGSLALKGNNKTSLVSPLYECFTTSVNNKFLLEWFDSSIFKRETYSRFEGGVRNTLTFNNLITIPITLPNIESQEYLAKFFSQYKKQIEINNKYFERLIQLKKGLSQQMFV